jgi:2-polyprenyl-3-methyl-5-hydroxy-6-metoxy-1,4-benzoquinol methylase
VNTFVCDLTDRTSIPCRICGGDQVAIAATLSDVPRSNHRLLRQAEIARDRPMDMRILQCLHCDFVFCAYGLDDSFYETDYLNAPAFSGQMAAFQRKQAEEFVARFSLVGKSILEVGCGEGSYLEILRECGVATVGVEPSPAQATLARDRGFDVETGLVDADRIIKGAPYDGFVTREVLEHVPDIKGFLLGIRRNMRVGACGLVEVPNLEKLLREKRFYDFIPEHVNYFTRRTLRLALELSGFTVVDVFTGMTEEYLIAYVGLTESEASALESLKSRSEYLGQRLRSYLESCAKQGKRVGIWGAGGKGLNLLAAAKVRHVAVLVDGDKHKHGLSTPVTHLTVEHPDQLVKRQVDTVIVTAPAYRNEIVAELRSRLGFGGEIVVIAEDLEVVPDV